MDVKNIFKYLAYLMIIAALFIGTKMAGIIGAGEKIPEMLIVAHSHTLGMSILALVVYLDLKNKDMEKFKPPLHSGEISFGAMTIGTLLAFAGFMLMYESQFALGGMLSGIGERLIILGVFLFLIVSIMQEILK